MGHQMLAASGGSVQIEPPTDSVSRLEAPAAEKRFEACFRSSPVRPVSDDVRCPLSQIVVAKSDHLG